MWLRLLAVFMDAVVTGFTVCVLNHWVHSVLGIFTLLIQPMPWPDVWNCYGPESPLELILLVYWQITQGEKTHLLLVVCFFIFQCWLEACRRENRLPWSCLSSKLCLPWRVKWTDSRLFVSRLTDVCKQQNIWTHGIPLEVVLSLLQAKYLAKSATCTSLHIVAQTFPCFSLCLNFCYYFLDTLWFWTT